MSETPPNQTFQAPTPQPQQQEVSKKKITWSVISVAIILIIWLFSRISLPLPLDWILHLITYFALGYALNQAIGLWSLAWVLAAWFGVLEEIQQAYFPGRLPDVLGWFFALIGAGVGAYFTTWQTEYQNKQSKQQPAPATAETPEQPAAAMPDFEFAPPPAPQTIVEAPHPDTVHPQAPPAHNPQPSTHEAHAPVIDTEFHPNNNAPVHESAQAVEVSFGHKAKNKDENKKG